jgi:hypothetical protein
VSATPIRVRLWWERSDALGWHIEHTIDPPQPFEIAQALRLEIQHRIHRLILTPQALSRVDFGKTIRLVANSIARSWALATIDGFVGRHLIVVAECGPTPVPNKWRRIILRGRKRGAFEIVDATIAKIDARRTTRSVRMGEKTSLLRGAP